MHRATLRQLRVFATVARHLSFSAAAKELHLTQPAVSMQVRQLEQAAGLPLFEQVGRRIALTEAGRELTRYAVSMFELLREADEQLQAMKGVTAGVLRIGAVSTAKYFAPVLFAAFGQEHPGVNIKFSVGNREETVRQLAENEADLVIMGRPPRELRTVAEPFARHPLSIVAAPEHPLARGRRIAFDRVAAEPFLIREEGSGTRASMERVFKERGHSYRPLMEVSSNETIKQAVMAGMGLGFISLYTVGLELQSGRLALLDVVGLPLIRDWYVIHRQDKRLLPAAAAFREFLLREAAALIERATGISAAGVPHRRGRAAAQRR